MKNMIPGFCTVHNAGFAELKICGLLGTNGLLETLVWMPYLKLHMSVLFQFTYLFTLLVFCFQESYGSPPWNKDFPSISYTTPAESVTFTSDNYEEQLDQRDVSSNASDSNVMESEDVDIKIEQDALFSEQSSHQLYNADHEIFRGVDVQQIDDAEGVCNSNTCDQIHTNCLSHKTNTSKKSYECDVCHKTFKFPSKLATHKRTHSGDKPHACDMCDMAFSRASDLNRHKYVHSGIKRFICDICSRAFNHLSALTVHKRIHTGVKPYVCVMCEMAFRTASDLRRHTYNVHSNIKPYTCDICNKAFKHMSDLATHKRIHGDEKSYMRFICDICNRAFNHLSALTVHKRIHTGARPFVCYLCDMDFRTASDLSRHTTVHSDVKPFTCDVCNKAFKQMSDLTTHKRVHSGEKPFVCDVCKRAYSNDRGLSRHRRTVHMV